MRKAIVGRFRVLVPVVLVAFSCGDSTPALHTLALETRLIRTIDGDSVLASDSGPLLQAPAYLRFDSLGSVWTIDTGRKQVLGLDTLGRVTVYGSSGTGPGELEIVLAIDVAPDGRVWVADVGRGKLVGYVDQDEPSEFFVDHQPLGVAAPTATTVWAGGNLLSSLLVRYGVDGSKIGPVGLPVSTDRRSFRFNQGIAASGQGPCAVAWAYTFRSIVQCFSADGSALWRVEGPISIIVEPSADPDRMQPDDEFAYIDVAVSDSRVYALFYGGAVEEDLQSRTVHVFDALSGEFLGQELLPRPAKQFGRSGKMLAVLSRNLVPTIYIYEIINER